MSGAGGDRSRTEVSLMVLSGYAQLTLQWTERSVIPPSTSDSPKPSLDSADARRRDNESNGSEKSDFHLDLCYQLDIYGVSDGKSTHSMVSGRGRGKSSSSSLEAMTSKREVVVRLLRPFVQSSSKKRYQVLGKPRAYLERTTEVQARGVEIVLRRNVLTDRELAG